MKAAFEWAIIISKGSDRRRWLPENAANHGTAASDVVSSLRMHSSVPALCACMHAEPLLPRVCRDSQDRKHANRDGCLAHLCAFGRTLYFAQL